MLSTKTCTRALVVCAIVGIAGARAQPCERHSTATIDPAELAEHVARTRQDLAAAELHVWDEGNASVRKIASDASHTVSTLTDLDSADVVVDSMVVLDGALYVLGAARATSPADQTHTTKVTRAREPDTSYVACVRILSVCGSLQKKSANLDLLRLAAAVAPVGVDVMLFDGLRRLPYFDPDLEADGASAPAAVEEWRRALRESSALLIASPEYGHSLPGSLKNGLDWVIGSGELYRKPVAITASVPTVERGLRGLGALRQTLLAVDAAIVSDAPIARDAEIETATRALVASLVARASEQLG